ncbi:glycoside hydrolase superfamily [Pelagophyceae sp. CCMP2097]|nr:glycoside hydrolase superfamily [Pelagophyceae sp. CCMP2097]|mmetsp:Transcript_14054/g.49971  ORF Transcript_14054/g.49971 Transcript_14054/m.49971 type:complete len:455 (-) Transcript_14054:307-1671(-)
MRLLLLAAVAGAAASTKSPNVGLLPAMGYNTWNDVRCDNVSAARVEEIANELERTGLRALGYDYVNIDDCWSEEQLAPDGSLVPKKSAFPNGMGAVADWLHARGFKMGLYADRGYKTCAFRPGSRGREAQHAAQFAGWGVDYLKYDSCFSPNLRRKGALEDYAKMRDALNATGRDVLFSACGWNSWYAPHGADLAHAWRISADCDEWANVYVAIRTNERLTKYASAGAFNDPDMLLGSALGATHLTPQQSRAQFAMWAVMTAPLLIGAPLASMSAWDLATYSNAEVIAVDQDFSAVQGRVVHSTCPRKPPLDNWWCSPWSMPADVAAVWTKGLRTAAFGIGLAAAAFKSRKLVILAALPIFYSVYLQHHRPTTDACHQVWAKPMANGGLALAFVNFSPKSVDVACDAKCLAKAKAPKKFTVRDCSHNIASDAAALQGVRLAGDGDAVLYRLDPA